MVGLHPATVRTRVRIPAAAMIYFVQVGGIHYGPDTLIINSHFEGFFTYAQKVFYLTTFENFINKNFEKLERLYNAYKEINLKIRDEHFKAILDDLEEIMKRNFEINIFNFQGNAIVPEKYGKKRIMMFSQYPEIDQIYIE